MPFFIKPSAAFLTLFLAAGQRALAVNDWSVPCTQGKCSWDLPAESGASGSVNIVSLLTYTKHIAFLGPSLTSCTCTCIVGPRQCDFGHYPCRWLANHDEMQPD